MVHGLIVGCLHDFLGGHGQEERHVVGDSPLLGPIQVGRSRYRGVEIEHECLDARRCARAGRHDGADGLLLCVWHFYRVGDPTGLLRVNMQKAPLVSGGGAPLVFYVIPFEEEFK